MCNLIDICTVSFNLLHLYYILKRIKLIINNKPGSFIKCQYKKINDYQSRVTYYSDWVFFRLFFRFMRLLYYLCENLSNTTHTTLLIFIYQIVKLEPFALLFIRFGYVSSGFEFVLLFSSSMTRRGIVFAM